MKVISLKSNKKLLKGLEYEAQSFDNTQNPIRYRANSIHIKGFGWYQCKNFTDLSGNPLSQIKYNNPQFTISTTQDRIVPTELKKGDILVCSVERYKYLVKGAKYRVQDIKEPNTWSVSIRLEGYSRWIKFSNWTFRKLTLQETRDLALSQIFDKPENFAVDFVRKIDKSSNKVQVLLQSLAKSILDNYRHHYDLIDWTIEKNKIQGLKKEDFNEILNLPLAEILKQYEQK
jgi:hypothetical protein